MHALGHILSSPGDFEVEILNVLRCAESLSPFLLGIRARIQGNTDFCSPRVFIIITFSSSQPFTYFLFVSSEINVIDSELKKCLDASSRILCQKSGEPSSA